MQMRMYDRCSVFVPRVEVRFVSRDESILDFEKLDQSQSADLDAFEVVVSYSL